MSDEQLEEATIDELMADLPEIPHEDKVKFTTKYIGMDGTGMLGEDLITLTSLICAFVMANRKKNESITVQQVIDAIRGVTDNRHEEYLRERVSLICEIFLNCPGSKFRTFGLTSAADIKKEINRIMDGWIPF